MTAAIATGNTVLAKPAEQTSLIALRAIELMTSVGLPHGVVQAVIAQGSEVAAFLFLMHVFKRLFLLVLSKQPL